MPSNLGSCFREKPLLDRPARATPWWGLAAVDDLPPCPRVGGALGHFAGLPHQVEDDARGDGPSRSSISRFFRHHAANSRLA
jgi:hypothetical protein